MRSSRNSRSTLGIRLHLKVCSVLAGLLVLPGCAAAFVEAGLAEASIGIASRAAAGSAMEGMAVSGIGLRSMALRGSAAAIRSPLIISEDIASSLAGVRFSPAVRGSLSESLNTITAYGTRAPVLEITAEGFMGHSGQAVARILPNSGRIIAGNGRIIGYLTSRGHIFEFLESGASRRVGILRGLTGNRVVNLFDTATRSRIVGAIQPGAMVQIVGIQNGGYLVLLADNAVGWLAPSALASIMLLAAHQQQERCQNGPGAVVTSTNRFMRFDRCRSEGEVVVLDTSAGQQRIFRQDVATFLFGGAVRDYEMRERRKMLAQLAMNGTLSPPASAYGNLPAGYGGNAGNKNSGGLSLPAGYEEEDDL